MNRSYHPLPNIGISIHNEIDSKQYLSVVIDSTSVSLILSDVCVWVGSGKITEDIKRYKKNLTLTHDPDLMDPKSCPMSMRLRRRNGGEKNREILIQ